MNLKSFGCSFIFGSELADDYTINFVKGRSQKASQLTWPAHLSKHLGYDHTCYAWPGSGNLQILEQVLNHASVSDSSDLFVIGWTWIDRFDYYDQDSESKLKWHTIMPSDNTQIAKMYFRDIHSEYRDKLTNLGYIKTAIDTLNEKGIPFVMTYLDQLLFDQQWHVTPAVRNLQEYVKPYMTMFDNTTFLEWSRRQGYPESANSHPLEDAHRAAGDYIIKVFDRQNTVDC